MKNLNTRIKKIENLKKKPGKFGFAEFFSKCIDLVDGATRGIPSDHRGQTAEKEAQQNQLFADYPEYAAKFHQRLSELENR
jgi:hypothetical protein